MNKLPLALLAGCLHTDFQVNNEELERCAPEVTALEQSCETWDGTFAPAVIEARECFSMEVRILCQSPGPFEPHTLIIKPKL